MRKSITELNTGNYNTGNRNTGNWNTGSLNTGDWNTGDRNTGCYNTGSLNTGDWNTGDRNTGCYNTGYCNTGYWNTGDRNTGCYNTGYCNTGSWNTGSWNIGCFNTITPETILVFNKECSRSEWEKAKMPRFIYNVEITYWVAENKMTDQEKIDDPDFFLRGGQLRSRSYKEAWKIAYDNAPQEDRDLIKQLPNFDAEIFFEISGIDLRT